MGNLYLGINTGFAVNRYPLPEQWLKIIGENLKLKYVQLTADLINPSLDDSIIEDLINRINFEKSKYDIEIDSLMTGAFTRVNHFSHPDEKIRIYWKKWFIKLFDIAKGVGANNVSTHFGILCYDDIRDNDRREFILKETVKIWKELAVYGKNIGLKYLSWEPMSISREYGETIKETKKIQDLLKDSAIPIKLCLDVGHGDKTSKYNLDLDYRNWLKEFANESPLLHVKQVLKNSSSHHPFIEEFNQEGIINPEEIIEILQNKTEDTLILLEHGFREREPTDSLVLNQLIESTNTWKKAFDKFNIPISE